MAIRIVTDSTADLSPEQLAKYSITAVPLTVHFGSESFLDGVEMSPEGFWEKLKTNPPHPKTAQPAPGDFLTVYQKLHAEGHEVLSIHISSNLSGTLNSAQIAAQMLPEAKITTVDTRSVSLGLGMLVVEAARMAEAGKSVQEIVAWIEQTAKRVYILFTLDSLEFLQKNGRVGKAQALLGGLLGIKPILHIDREGFVAPADKVRGKSKVLGRAMELMQEAVPAGRKLRMSILFTNNRTEAEEWVNAVKGIYEVEEHWVGPLGPVVATNGGPGTIGVAFYEV